MSSTKVKTVKQTGDKPALVEGRDRGHPVSMNIAGRNVMYWLDKHVAGGAMLVVSCQEHSLDRWRREGRAIIRHAELGEATPVTQNDLYAVSYGTDEEAVKAIMDLRKKIEKAGTPAVSARVERLYRQLLSVIAMIERFFDGHLPKQVDAAKAVKK